MSKAALVVYVPLIETNNTDPLKLVNPPFKFEKVTVIFNTGKEYGIARRIMDYSSSMPSGQVSVLSWEEAR